MKPNSTGLMTGWIKMRTCLFDEPPVLAISRACAMDVYGVIGRLHRVWSWADRNTENGKISNVTLETIDDITGTSGFASAMAKVGWLAQTSTGIEFPNYCKHNGPTGKKRANAAKRAAKFRNASRNAHVTHTKRSERDDSVTKSAARIRHRNREFVVVDSLRLKPDWTNGQKEALEADARQCGLEPNTLACWVALWGYAQVFDSFVIAAQSGRKPAKIPGLVLTALRAKPHRTPELAETA